MSLSNPRSGFVIRIELHNGNLLIKTLGSENIIAEVNPATYNTPNFITEEDIISCLIPGHLGDVPISVAPDAGELLTRIVMANKYYRFKEFK